MDSHWGNCDGNTAGEPAAIGADETLTAGRPAPTSGPLLLIAQRTRKPTRGASTPPAADRGSGSGQRPWWRWFSSSTSRPGRGASSLMTEGTSPAPSSAPGMDCTGFGSTSWQRSSIIPCRSAPSGSSTGSGATQRWAITWSISSSTPRHRSWCFGPAPLGGPRRLSGGGHLCTSSGVRGIGGLDHGIEEYAFRRLLLGCHAPLPPLRPHAEARWYLGALGLFVLALLSKTATVMLPAVLPVIFWWQRGRLSWKRDLLPLVPFFLAARLAAMMTVWVERDTGAVGSEFDFGFVERCLIAGRAIWFYLGKLVWPLDLVFIYPRWQVSRASGGSTCFPRQRCCCWRWRGGCGGAGGGPWRRCSSSP